MNIELVLLTFSALLIASVVAGRTGYRFGIPVLLLFLCVGMLFGSDGLGLQFHNAREAQWVGIVALSVILFTGGMDTKFSDIRPVWREGVVLSTLGVLLTTAFTGLFIWALARFGWLGAEFTLPISLLLAATMSSTDSASVFAILRSQQIRLKERLRPMLELESGSNDPMAYMLVIVLIQWTVAGEMQVGDILRTLAVQFGLGTLCGVGLGWLTAHLISRVDWINKSLYPVLILGSTFFTFSLTALLGGNGYLAVYLAGVIVGNKRWAHRRETTLFMDGMTWLFQIVLFITLGLLVNPHELLLVAPAALLIAVFVIVIGRPFSVWISLAPFRGLSLRARSFVSWVGLRGAVPIIFATYPVIEGVENGRTIFNIVFFITLVSLVVQGISIPRVASWLRLSLPADSRGNSFGVELTEDLGTTVYDHSLTAAMLPPSQLLRDLSLPPHTLVVMVRRGHRHIVPNGSLRLCAGDTLLLIRQDED